jgi:3-dehydroquinate synthase
MKPDRSTTLVALGGGVVGDITGFAASVLLRGVNFIQIPTTLLAQVDSSVGGKTGINSAHGKNLIGSFHQPQLVIADISLIASLPEREKMAGYAEMMKYGLINDTNFFSWLEQNANAMMKGDANLLTQGVIASCKAKSAIVSADEKEQGQRALLNFGHTFGHALEAETGFSNTLLHGEAVAIGMMLAFRLSVKMGLCSVPDYDRVRAHYQAMNLPDSPLCIQPKWDVDALVEHMEHDKKNRGGHLTLILTHGIGKAFIANHMEASQLRAFLHECLREP